MSCFIEGEHRQQSTLFPDRIENYIKQENSGQVIDVFVDELDLLELGFLSIEFTTRSRHYT